MRTSEGDSRWDIYIPGEIMKILGGGKWKEAKSHQLTLVS